MGELEGWRAPARERAEPMLKAANYHTHTQALVVGLGECVRVCVGVDCCVSDQWW